MRLWRGHAICAIWSDLDLFLDVIYASIFVPHSIYSFIRRKRELFNSSDYDSTNIRLGYLKQIKVRGDITAYTTSTIAQCALPSRSIASGVHWIEVCANTDFPVVGKHQVASYLSRT